MNRLAPVPVFLSMLAVHCGSSGSGNSPPGSGDAGSSSIHCQAGGPGRDYCFCGTDIGANDPDLVTQCSEATLQSSVGACCKLNDSTQDCVCNGYICSFPSLENMTDCECQWGQEFSSMTTNSCTDTYCCQGPATGPLGGTCACGTTACPAGTTQVAQCGLSDPAPACPPGATAVTSCM